MINLYVKNMYVQFTHVQKINTIMFKNIALTFNRYFVN